MSNYTKSTNFASKDALSSGNPLKIVKGTEIDTEFNNIAIAVSTKTDNSSAVITGGTIDGTVIGGTTTAAGSFTSLAASGTVSGTGFSTYLASPPAIGGTAPNTGAFTTLSTSGTTTFSGGTANGVGYLNGSKQFTTGSALTFDGSKLGVSQQVNVAANAGAVSIANGLTLATGYGVSYLNSTDGAGSLKELYQSAAFFAWTTSGGSEGMRLTSTGLGIGTSSPGQKLEVNGNALFTGGQIILNANSANYLYFKNASKLVFSDTIGNERLVIDSSGNLGLGVTPNAWYASSKAFQTSAGSLYTYTTDRIFLGQNIYIDATGADKYAATGYASTYRQLSGAHTWYIAPSGTAGNAISFTQAMTLDASGNLGIGTSSPGAKLHVAGEQLIQPTTVANAKLSMRHGSIGNNNYFEVDSSSNTIFGTNNAERARIDSSGNLLVGKTNASATDVGTWVDPYGYVSATKSTSTNSDNSFVLYSTGASAYRFYVGMGGTISATNTTISAISDQRFKENVRDLDVGLDKIMALKPRKFDWKAGKGKDIKNDRGFIAQEFEQVFPDLIDEWKDPAPEGEEPYKAVRADLIPVLVKAMQEQQAIIEQLTARVAQLEGK